MTASSRLVRVREWLRSAREDLELAREIAAQGRRAPWLPCYHAHQAVEKTLKAVLHFESLLPPRDHDLDSLRNAIPPGWQVSVAFPSFARMNQLGIQARYPDSAVTVSVADALWAVQEADNVWAAVSADLMTRGFDVANELI